MNDSERVLAILTQEMYGLGPIQCKHMIFLIPLTVLLTDISVDERQHVCWQDQEDVCRHC